MSNPSSHIQRISIDQLVPGMFIVKVDQSWIHTPFFFHKQLLKSVKSIEQLRQCGVKEVWIDLSRGASPVAESIGPTADPTTASGFESEEMPSIGCDVVASEVLRSPDHSVRLPENEKICLSLTTPTDRDFQKARRVLDSAVKAVEEIFSGVKSGGPIHATTTKQVVTELLEQVIRSETALFHLIRLFALKDFAQCLYRHSVDVCVTALVLGVEGELPRQEIEDLGVGALLHDIGYIRLPRNLLRKRVPLSRQEQQVLDRHVEIGCEIVAGSPGLPHSVGNVVSQHHERMDGSGFPRGSGKNLLTREGRIVAIVDHYEALVTECYGRVPLLPAQAIRELYRLGQLEHLDPVWVNRFIRVIGVYPVGSLVQLSSGERAVVVVENSQDKTRPRIHVITNPCEGRFYALNLADVRTDPKPEIIGCLDPHKEKIDIGRFLGCGENVTDAEAGLVADKSS